jgi:hypothetical protein
MFQVRPYFLFGSRRNMGVPAFAPVFGNLEKRIGFFCPSSFFLPDLSSPRRFLFGNRVKAAG